MRMTVTGLLDMHVHLREPGFTHKEDIAAGSRAAARGGVTALCCMPNTNPVIDTPEAIVWVLNRAKESAPIRVFPIAAVTFGQKGLTLTDFQALKKAGAIALSDDGIPIIDAKVMKNALLCAHEAGLPLIAHCEPETDMLARDLELCAQTGCPLHVAHVSRGDSVALIRQAKKDGVSVTCETAPHYMSALAMGKMNPPLASPADVEAVLEGLTDGTIDCIATDHAPHSPAEKALPYDRQPNGVIGLETLLAASLTFLEGRLTVEKILAKMSSKPAQILGIDLTGDTVTIDTGVSWVVAADQFVSKARNTPFEGLTLRGAVIQTVSQGNIVYTKEDAHD